MMSTSKTIYGTDTIGEIMQKENMKNSPFVSCNQKYSAYDCPKDNIHENDKLYPNGNKDVLQIASDKEFRKEKEDYRSKHAAGGVAKYRLGYPDIDGPVGSDRGD